MGNEQPKTFVTKWAGPLPAMPQIIEVNASPCFSLTLLYKLKGGSEGRSWDEISSSSAEAMDPDAVARAFVEHYYLTFDSNRGALRGLYHDASMLTFEGHKILGAVDILAKLTSLPFQQCAHAISTVDCQPSGPAGGMLVFVSGSLKLGGESHSLKFSQMFQLMPTPQGSFYVLNDIFRLNYA